MYSRSKVIEKITLVKVYRFLGVCTMAKRKSKIDKVGENQLNLFDMIEEIYFLELGKIKQAERLLQRKQKQLEKELREIHGGA